MLPVKLHLKNIGPYEDETVDFQGIPGNVIAIVGENGAGKTMLVDSIFAALYRYFPSRDSIYKYCRGKAQITFDFRVNGKQYRSTVNIDPKKREMEPWLFEGSERNGMAPLTDGKNSTFDKVVRDLLGPAEQVLASVYSAQNRAGSFIALSKAKRKELFIEMLGLAKLQKVSDEAALRERAAKDEYDKVAWKVDALRVASEKKDLALEPYQQRLTAARDEVGTEEAGIELDTFEVGVLRSKVQVVKDIEARRVPVLKRIDGLKRDIAETIKAIRVADAIVQNIDNLRELVGVSDGIEVELQKLRKETWDLVDQKTQYHKRVEEYMNTLHDLEGQKKSQENIVKTVGIRLARAGSDASIIGTVPCHAEGECAECQFLVNAIAARDTISDMEAEIDNARAASLALDGQIKSLPRPNKEQLSQIEGVIKNLTERISTLEAQAVKASTAKSDLAASEAVADTLKDLTKRHVRLVDDTSVAQAELAVLDEELSKSKDFKISLAEAEAKLRGAQQRLDTARVVFTKAMGDLARVEAEKENAFKAYAELTELTPTLERLDTDRKQWALLAKAFGKTGIQSLEIDAAGPTISEIVNDLLFSCFGPRFSVRFVTQVLKDDKSGYKDDFDIYVTDAESEREGSIDDLSGGEKVIVSEGLSLAIALFNQGRSQISWGSLFRDEASSAVDDRRAPLYIRMLQRAREQGHFERLFFIAHQQRVTEGADAKVLVTSGKVTFE